MLTPRRGGFLTRPGSQAQAAAGWDPFTEFDDLYQRMGQLMSSALGGLWPNSSQGWPPAADLTETEDAYVAEVELPGVKKDDIHVELTGQELAITGEYRDTGTEGRALARARRAGHFEYRVMLPGQADADKITASLADRARPRSRCEVGLVVSSYRTAHCVDPTPAGGSTASTAARLA